PGPNRGVKRAGFVVLVGALMPAVLIETGFLSNREDARLLGTQSFQEKIAWGIADSVDEFFVRNEHLWEQVQ
ncbi:MAG TPA: N-acetylmuramoyl-L-alanine amidase, partial [Longimicrobiales bacterium]|nr:N-acetylmuramoyl-L-alanine amidase [Longimicrobiales bacterium]